MGTASPGFNAALRLLAQIQAHNATFYRHSPLAEAFARTAAKFCVVSFDTDWLYPTQQSRKLVHVLSAAGAAVSFVELSAPFGHDSFLLDVPALDRVVTGFLSQ